MQRASNSGFQLCVDAAQRGPVEDYSRAYGLCWDIWQGTRDFSDYWKEAFAVSAVLFVALWILGLAIYWSVIWVLSGRKHSNS